MDGQFVLVGIIESDNKTAVTQVLKIGTVEECMVEKNILPASAFLSFNDIYVTPIEDFAAASNIVTCH